MDKMKSYGLTISYVFIPLFIVIWIVAYCSDIEIKKSITSPTVNIEI